MYKAFFALAFISACGRQVPGTVPAAEDPVPATSAALVSSQLVGDWATLPSCSITHAIGSRPSCGWEILRFGSDGSYSIFGARAAGFVGTTALPPPSGPIPDESPDGSYVPTPGGVRFTSAVSDVAAFTLAEQNAANAAGACGFTDWQQGIHKFVAPPFDAACARLVRGTEWPSLAGASMSATITITPPLELSPGTTPRPRMTLLFQSTGFSVGAFFTIQQNLFKVP
jgi:hypothetical protein